MFYISKVNNRKPSDRYVVKYAHVTCGRVYINFFIMCGDGGTIITNAL